VLMAYWKDTGAVSSVFHASTAVGLSSATASSLRPYLASAGPLRSSPSLSPLVLPPRQPPWTWRLANMSLPVSRRAALSSGVPADVVRDLPIAKRRAPPSRGAMDDDSVDRAARAVTSPSEAGNLAKEPVPAGSSSSQADTIDLVIVRCKEVIGGGRGRRFAGRQDAGEAVLRALGKRFREVHVMNKCSGTSRRRPRVMVPGRVWLHEIPNVGTEEFGYFEFLSYRHPSYASWTIFLQADEVRPDLELACLRSAFTEPVLERGWAWIQGVWVNDRTPFSIMKGAHDTFRLVGDVFAEDFPDIKRLYEILAKARGRCGVNFYAGASFMVHRRILMRFPPKTWKYLQAIQKRGALRLGYAMEATWHLLWDGALSNASTRSALRPRRYSSAFACGIFDCERSETCRSVAFKTLSKAAL